MVVTASCSGLLLDRDRQDGGVEGKINGSEHRVILEKNTLTSDLALRLRFHIGFKRDVYVTSASAM